jgi:AcrR family transcriptional regulator
MPRIEAATVPEHHARRRSAIVDAAVVVLRESGPAAVTPAAVAGAAGLARSSVYQYYPSTGALLGSAVEEEFRRTRDALEAATARARSARGRLTAYLDVALEAAVAGHRPMGAYAGLDLPTECRVRLGDLHASLLRPLVDAVRDVGSRDAEGTAGLVVGAVGAAAASVRHGEPLPAARRRLHRFVLAGCAAR